MKRAHAWSIVVLLLIIIAIVLWVCYLFWGLRTAPKPQHATSFETCVAMGNPVMESYPRQCRDPETGRMYVERTATTQSNLPTMRTFVSTKGAAIQIDNWADNTKLTSPLTLTGKVPGSWSFEASFPVILREEHGNVIARGHASLQGDWMTDDPVPFTVTLQFTVPVGSSSGSLVLQKDNPSGLVENDDSLTIAVRYN